MSSPQYMPLYVGDYLADAAHISTLSHGAYLLLIMNYWQRGKALPANDRVLAGIAKLTLEQWADVKLDLADFFQEVDGCWRHKRIEQELETARGKAEKAKAAGKASAEARANARSTDVEQPSNHKVRLGKVREEEEQTLSGKPDPVPVKAKAKPEYPAAFNLLHDTFPKHPNASKSEALKAWTRLSEEDQDLALDGAVRYAEFLEKERRRRPDYPQLHLVTYINQRRWESLLEDAA